MRLVERAEARRHLAQRHRGSGARGPRVHRREGSMFPVREMVALRKWSEGCAARRSEVGSGSMPLRDGGPVPVDSPATRWAAVGPLGRTRGAPWRTARGAPSFALVDYLPTGALSAGIARLRAADRLHAFASWPVTRELLAFLRRGATSPTLRLLRPTPERLGRAFRGRSPPERAAAGSVSRGRATREAADVLALRERVPTVRRGVPFDRCFVRRDSSAPTAR